MANDMADVIIIGAGAAGLAAADVLSAEGKRIVVVEGRSRLGGRIHTMHDPAWPLPIERGAEFVHGKPKETLDILRASACSLYDVTDEHWLFEKGRLRKSDGFFEDVEKVLAIVERVGAEDMTFDAALAKFGGRFTPAAKRSAKSFVEGFDAADSGVVSCRWLAESQKESDAIEGDRLFRVLAGYDRITQFLRSGIDDPRHRIELETLVRRVEWSAEGATVECVNARGDVPSYRARHVLITVPIGVLQLQGHEEGHIAFEPALPAGKREAIGAMRMGPVVKMVLRFREAFWEEVIPELDFFHAPGEPFHTWWTTLPVRSSVLTAWAGGPHAAGLSEKSSDALLTEAMGSLSKLLKMPRRKIAGQLLASHVCNWQTEALSRGAYSYAAAGGAKAPKALAMPVEGTLFFAGEATHTGMAGTVAAAIGSGHRAAQQILRAADSSFRTPSAM
jgi:monoamine oxidase